MRGWHELLSFLNSKMPSEDDETPKTNDYNVDTQSHD